MIKFKWKPHWWQQYAVFIMVGMRTTVNITSVKIKTSCISIFYKKHRVFVNITQYSSSWTFRTSVGCISSSSELSKKKNNLSAIKHYISEASADITKNIWFYLMRLAK